MISRCIAEGDAKKPLFTLSNLIHHFSSPRHPGVLSAYSEEAADTGCTIEKLDPAGDRTYTVSYIILLWTHHRMDVERTVRKVMLCK